MLPPLARELYNGIPGIRLDNAPWLARYSALFYAVRGALAVLSRTAREPIKIACRNVALIYCIGPARKSNVRFDASI